MLDFHNHLIPGVDDGASSLDESISGLEKMTHLGIEHVIATPHFRASVLTQPTEFQAQMTRIDSAWEVLLAAANARFPSVRLDRGVELALDEPTVSVSDVRVRLAGTRFILVEFPYFTIPPNSAQPLADLRRAGYIPIVAHPERYENVSRHLELFHDWKRKGALLQLNAGSLVGVYGKRSERIAWRCLEAGVVDYMCSDYHARGTCLTGVAKERMEKAGGLSQFSALTTLNGHRLLQGLEPTPVVPFARRHSPLARIKAAILRKR